MGGSKAFDEFERLLKQKITDKTKPHVVWAKVKEVNWQEKTMVATGILDDLDYFDVILGLGHITQKPKIGSKCLLGVIENKAAATFLIEAESVEELVIVQDTSKLTIKEEGFLVEKGSESLTAVLSDFMDEVLKIIVVNGTTVDVPALTAIKARLNTILK